MKNIIFLIVLSQVLNICFANDEIIEVYETIHNQSLKLQKMDEQNDVYKNLLNDFYTRFFLDGQNIFKSVGDNSEGVLNCGFLSLKKKCVTEVFKTQVVMPDSKTACINVYGINESLEESIVQSTILFVKDQKEWKVIGSRLSYTNETMLIYGLLNGDKPQESYTDRCFNFEKVHSWKNNFESDVYDPLKQ